MPEVSPFVPRVQRLTRRLSINSYRSIGHPLANAVSSYILYPILVGKQVTNYERPTTPSTPDVSLGVQAIPVLKSQQGIISFISTH